MCATFLQSSADPDTHIYSWEIVYEKKVELGDMRNCAIPPKFFFLHPWNIKFGTYEMGELGPYMLFLSLLPSYIRSQISLCAFLASSPTLK